MFDLQHIKFKDQDWGRMTLLYLTCGIVA